MFKYAYYLFFLFPFIMLILGFFANFFFTSSLYSVTLKWILKALKQYFLEGPGVSG